MNYLRIAFLVAISALLFSCGSSGGGQDANTGGISFSLLWEAPSNIATPGAQKTYRAPAPDVCVDFGIATITMRIQNTSGGTVASQSFTCSSHSGVVNSIPAGSGYSLIIEGLLSDNSIAWTGTKTLLTVTASQTTAAGTVTMNYQGSDTTPPTILTTNPASGANNIPVTAPITVTFSEDMAVSSISETTITLQQGMTPVTSVVTYNTTNKTATLVPSANLAYSTAYTVAVTTGVTDMAKRSLPVANIWNFATEAAPTSAPAAPTGVVASAGNTQNTITWNASTSATSYNIYWSTTSGVTKANGTKISSLLSTTYPHTALTNGTTYYYVVTAVNAVGESPDSSQVSATPSTGGSSPAAPTSVSAIAGNAQNTITWTASAGATSYNIYWSVTSGVTKANGTKIIGATNPYIHAGRTNGTAYYYVVTAVNAVGESPDSSQVSATPQVPGAWIARAPLPSARYANAAASINGLLYAVGGDNYVCGVFNTLEVYDPATNTWTAKANMPTARDGLRAAEVNGILYVVGGGTGCPTPNLGLTTVEAYNPATNTWSTRAPLTTSRLLHGLGVVNGILYAVGGEGGASGLALASIEAYDPVANTWTTKAPMPTARYGLAVGVVNNILYAAGGGTAPNNQLEAYDPAANTWTTKAVMPTARGFLGGGVVNGVFYAIGGSYSSALATVEAYDPMSNTWSTKPSMIETRDSPAIGVVGGTIYAVAGGSGGTIKATVESYSPITPDTWAPISTTDAPSARGHIHAQVWTGSQMIVWGGATYSGGYTYYNTGGKYDPATDSWTSTSTTNAPAARMAPRAVWTGAEMIVWGGYDNSRMNTGGKYNPATDTWTTTAALNAPSARVNHSIVWTGTEMIVWGGEVAPGNTGSNDGGKYNPTTDTWTATSLTNAPAARWVHNAVWTGTEMIVFGGGLVPGGCTNTGGKYNPSANTWTATATTNAPTKCDGYSAVWTGTEMIAWGGSDGTINNTGARYNPSADTWTTSSTTNAASARHHHAAVWTGNEMIVWGGDDGSTALGNGGKYNPSTNSWSVTAATNAASARTNIGFNGVWTGSQMIIWGGYAGSTYYNTGGKYTP